MRSEIGEGMMKEQFKQVAVCHVKCFIHTPRFCSKRKERCIPVTIQTSVNDVKNQSYRSKAIPSGDEPHGDETECSNNCIYRYRHDCESDKTDLQKF